MDKSFENLGVSYLGVSLNQSLYLYQQPMFMLTVSVVLIDENGVIVLGEDKEDKEDEYRFPGGIVKARQETIQFSAVRQVKEQTGIVLRKEALIPVDYRSSPERSKEGNVVDIGMVCMLEKKNNPSNIVSGTKWLEVDFNKGHLRDEKKLYMDHDVLLERAIGVAMMMKG